MGGVGKYAKTQADTDILKHRSPLWMETVLILGSQGQGLQWQLRVIPGSCCTCSVCVYKVKQEWEQMDKSAQRRTVHPLYLKKH